MTQLIFQRGEIEGSLLRISHLISILKGELPTAAPMVSGRKPMSAEARQRISDGLRASHIKRQSGITNAAPQTVPEEPAPVEQPTVAEPASRGRKATKA